MDNQPESYLNPKLELRQFPEKGGFGIFAKKSLQKGELLCMWGGRVVNRDTFAQFNDFECRHGLQIWDDLFQVTYQEGDPADYFNHSCEPNAGFNSPISLVAMRDVPAGEEICFDYAMSDANEFDQFPCCCGAAECRGFVSGKDWQIPELQERYNGYFSPYLQQRIDRMKHQAEV